MTSGVQMSPAHVESAQVSKAAQALHRRLIHVAGTDGCHHGQATHRIESRADDTAVDAVVTVMTD
jgi:hypothetical protein